MKMVFWICMTSEGEGYVVLLLQGLSPAAQGSACATPTVAHGGLGMKGPPLASMLESSSE